MNSFIYTAFHLATMTTVDCPHLKVIEQDNGVNWLMKFYVNDNLIDCIDMEHPRGAEIHNDIKALPVYDSYDEYVAIGTVESRLKEAINLTFY